jgi:NAD-reducing hydrogenase large subunit
VRAYDPCLSCATHALGKMPLKVELIDHQGNLISSKIKKNLVYAGKLNQKISFQAVWLILAIFLP